MLPSPSELTTCYERAIRAENRCQQLSEIISALRDNEAYLLRRIALLTGQVR